MAPSVGPRLDRPPADVRMETLFILAAQIDRASRTRIHFMRFAVLAVSILSLTIALSGCGGGGGQPAGAGAGSAGKKKYRIAVIPKGTTHEFWKSVHAGAANAARELGNVEVIWKGPLLED